MKKSNFSKLKTSLGRSFAHNLQHLGDFVRDIFTILLQIQHENNFLPTGKHWQSKVRRFLGICLCDFFIFTQISSFEHVSKRDAILAPVSLLHSRF